jgi:hypothetical protein
VTIPAVNQAIEDARKNIEKSTARTNLSFNLDAVVPGLC